MPKFTVKCSGPMERTFVVEANDVAHAKKRFTTYKHDPDAFASGIVTETKSDKDTSLEGQRIVEVKAVARPAGVRTPRGASSESSAADDAEKKAVA